MSDDNQFDHEWRDIARLTTKDISNIIIGVGILGVILIAGVFYFLGSWLG